MAWGGRAAVKWSPVEVDFLIANRESLPLTQLSQRLAKSVSAVKRKLAELDGKSVPGKKNKVSYIGFRKDLGISVRSAWEANFLRYLNYKGIRWLYEPKAFHFTEVKRGTTSYLPDFFLPGLDIYIELKGYLTPKGRTAVRRFRRYYPEDFKKMQGVPGSAKTKAAEFFRNMKIPIYCCYNDINKQYKDVIPNWE